MGIGLIGFNEGVNPVFDESPCHTRNNGYDVTSSFMYEVGWDGQDPSYSVQTPFTYYALALNPGQRGTAVVIPGFLDTCNPPTNPLITPNGSAIWGGLGAVVESTQPNVALPAYFFNQGTDFTLQYQDIIISGTYAGTLGSGNGLIPNDTGLQIYAGDTLIALFIGATGWSGPGVTGNAALSSPPDGSYSANITFNIPVACLIRIVITNPHLTPIGGIIGGSCGLQINVARIGP